MSAYEGRRSYKIVLLGEATVGKTTLRRMYMGETLKSGNYMPTMGVDFSVKHIDDDVIQIWDFAGQSAYKKIRNQFYKKALGILLMYDITNPDSFARLGNWINEAMVSLKSQVPLFILGNKSDLKVGADTEVKAEEVIEYIDYIQPWYYFDIKWFETSALTGHNIDLVFTNLVQVIEEWLNTHDTHNPF